MTTLNVTKDTVADIDDVDVLWEALKRARDQGDEELKLAIRARMGELQEERRFSELTDEELKKRIESLARHHGAEERVEQLPAWDQIGADGVAHVATINEALRANARDNSEQTLKALLDEWHRRHPESDAA